MPKNSAISARKVRDPDNPPLTRDQLARMRRAIDVIPHIVERFERKRGRPPLSGDSKTPVSIRLDRDAVAAFKAAGPGWQTRINDLVVKAAAKLKPAKPKPTR